MRTGRWVLLAYRLPRKPSTPRIALWRRLRRLGAAQVLDGLVGLPLDRRTVEQFEWLADSIVEEGGYASVLEALRDADLFGVLVRRRECWEGIGVGSTLSLRACVMPTATGDGFSIETRRMTSTAPQVTALCTTIRTRSQLLAALRRTLT